MKTTCLINNYNYQDFVVDAINSALNQSVAFDEIIVVDDGSTDQSMSVIQEKFANNAKVKVIAKNNQGQLSSFNEGYLASTGDIVFFLDSDDIYEETYLQEALNFYGQNQECDFLFCAMTEFGKSNRINKYDNSDRDFGFTVILTMCLKKWIGAPTSAISMRRSVLSQILPMPSKYLEDWRIRADDCLVWGASLVGARKYYLSMPLIRYRVHDNNGCYGRTFNYIYQVKRTGVVNAFFELFCSRYRYDQDLYNLAKYEFRTLTNPTFKDFANYRRIIQASNLPFDKKVEMTVSMFGSYLTKNAKYNKER